MHLQGQRTRSTRRSNARPGVRGNSDIGGRGLDTRADRKSGGQQYADRTPLKVVAAKMRAIQPGWNAGCAETCLSGVGRAGRNSTAGRQQGRRPSTPSYAMSLLSWEEHRGPAHLHHTMWRTPDPVPLCPLCTVFFRNTHTPIAQLKTPIALVVQVLAALTEGVGINAATRLYGVSKNSIYRWQERLSGLKKRCCCLP